MQGEVSGFFLIPQSHYSLLNEATAMLCSLALIGYGKHFLEFHNPQTEYLSESSFTVYIFHQSWLAVFALFLFSITDNTGVQIAGIIVLTFAATYSCLRMIVIDRISAHDSHGRTVLTASQKHTETQDFMGNTSRRNGKFRQGVCIQQNEVSCVFSPTTCGDKRDPGFNQGQVLSLRLPEDRHCTGIPVLSRYRNAILHNCSSAPYAALIGQIG
ncbi:MAG TPA: hypothetical protein O0X38_05595 [Methanocorpusculum sp.]|nr:hypothetical protein [Methanocorpusculum sp.]